MPLARQADHGAADVTELDRAIGALLGLAVGDAVGTTLEFHPPGSFTPIDDMVGGGLFSLTAGEWTDDTSMALCLAESILDTGTMDVADQLRRYLLWKDHGYLSSNGRCFDIGHTTRVQLERYRRTEEAVDPAPDENAAPNGFLMRLAAVPIRWHDDPAVAAEQSAHSSRTTHPAQRPVDACRLMGAMTSELIRGASFAEVTDPGFWRWGALHPEVADIAAGGWRHKEPPEIRGTGYCIAALEAALWAVDGADDIRDAALRAANLGDDADTTAAIAGQIAGARWGAEGIPHAWRKKVVAGDRITALARGLYLAGGGVTDQTSWAHDAFCHAWWVEPGRLLAGEYPGDKDAARARMKFDLLVDNGIRTFIDLTTSADRLQPYQDVVAAVATARQLELEHLSFPIPDLDVVDDAAYDTVTVMIERGMERGGVYVHCWGGVGRTGTVVGCVLADEGLNYDAIIERLASLRRGSCKEHRQAPEMPVQHEVIKRRVACRA